MENIKRKIRDEGQEKHLPVITETEEGFEIKVGEKEHPMEKEHYGEWIEINLEDGNSCKVFLDYTKKPKIIFHTKEKITKVRIYCNIHDLWEKNND